MIIAAKYRGIEVIALTCCLLAAACGGDKKKKLGEDWSARPLAPIDVTLEGVAVAVSMPEGMKLDKDDPGWKEWIADKDDYFSEPSIRLSLDSSPPGSVEEAVSDAMFDDKDIVARKEKVDGGIILTSHTKDKGLVRAQVWKMAGDKAVECRAAQAKSGGVPNPDATIAWLEKICLSVSPK